MSVYMIGVYKRPANYNLVQDGQAEEAEAIPQPAAEHTARLTLP